MLQALFKQKLGRAIKDGSFHGIEDTLTSSVIGLLQYLPDTLFLEILRDSCGASMDSIPKDIGIIHGVHFWERMGAEGTYNSNSVEPDVWIETELYDIIIEAKVSDSSYDNAQSYYQWFNEIVALDNYYEHKRAKGLIFIAMGGNESLKSKTRNINGEDLTIYAASWFDLLASVLRHMKNPPDKSEDLHIIRILDDIVTAMQYHNIISTEWFDTLLPEVINPTARGFIDKHWLFDNERFLEVLMDNKPSIEIESLSNIWTTI